MKGSYFQGKTIGEKKLGYLACVLLLEVTFKNKNQFCLPKEQSQNFILLAFWIRAFGPTDQHYGHRLKKRQCRRSQHCFGRRCPPCAQRHDTSHISHCSSKNQSPQGKKINLPISKTLIKSCLLSGIHSQEGLDMPGTDDDQSS